MRAAPRSAALRARLGGSLVLALLAGCALQPLAPPRPGSGEGGRPRYELAFTGLAQFAERDALAAIDADLLDFEQRGLRKSSIDDAAFALEIACRAAGFPFARVDYEYVPAAQGALPRVHLIVDEGPRVRLGTLSFFGAAAFDGAELAALFGVDEEASPRWYVASEIEAGLGAMRALYRSAGHLEAAISEPELAFDAAQARMDVSISVAEGPAWRLGALPIEPVGADEAGGADLEALLAELDGHLSSYVGRPYFPQVAFAVRGQALEFLAEAGHPDARVVFEERRGEDGLVTLRLSVAPGPRVAISSVTVSGAQRTDAEFVLERLALRPGETWSTSAQRRSLTELYRSGLFARVDVELEGEGGQRPVEVSVVERLPREWFVEPGYGSYEGPRVTAGWRDRNIDGEAGNLHFEGSLSPKARRVLAGITDPFFGPATSSDVSVFVHRREEPSYTSDELGVLATLTTRRSAQLVTSWGYGISQSKLSSVSAALPPSVAELDDVRVAPVSAGLSHDTRDAYFAPTSGHLTRASLEFGSALTASELDFLRARFAHAQYLPLGAGQVLALSWRTGLIAPIAGTDTIPLQERFFNGGESTVRSFKEDELGPVDAAGEPLGGEAFTVASAEWRRPLDGELHGALFLDLGNVVPDVSDYLSFPDLELAVGFGLRYMLPIGPVRLDIGFNPGAESGEDDWVAHLSVGMPF